jgi:hypothetical protein
VPEIRRSAVANRHAAGTNSQRHCPAERAFSDYNVVPRLHQGISEMLGPFSAAEIEDLIGTVDLSHASLREDPKIRASLTR